METITLIITVLAWAWIAYVACFSLFALVAGVLASSQVEKGGRALAFLMVFIAVIAIATIKTIPAIVILYLL